jgi:signal transduction histidine kinase
MDTRARAFSRLLFLRDPLDAEVEEFRAAVDWLLRHWIAVLAAYFAFLAIAVLPALLRERSPLYHAVAIVVPHLMLYLVAMMGAYGWVGYRINLANLKDYLPQLRKREGRRLSLLALAMWAIAGAVTGFFGARVGGGVWDSVDAWFGDTFTTPVLIVLFVALFTGFPELVARLRLREHDLNLRIRNAEAASERLARHTAESELRLLQAQVEPHFLYNTLANLRYLIGSDAPQALRMTDALIDYLRTAVTDIRAPHVTLGREVDHVRHYLALMQMRMQSRLEYEVCVPESLRAVPVPPLVLLTLVENAVKHGIAPRVEGGSVTLSAFDDGDRVRIEVADTGVGLPGRMHDAPSTRTAAPEAAATPSTGTGLANARSRLVLTYGETASLALQPNSPRGTRAIVHVPREGAPRQGDVRVVVVSDARTAAWVDAASKAGAAAQ